MLIKKKMNNFKNKILTKYQQSMNQLHDVGDGYISNSKDDQKAKNNLFKVYHGYTIASIVLAYSILAISIIFLLITKNPGWLIIMPFALVFPKTIKWSMANVLNIDEVAYYEWLKKNKQK